MGDRNDRDIRRGEPAGNKSVLTMLDYCLTHIEEDGLSDGVNWDTKVADSVTVEELVGALVRSEYEFEQLKGVGE